MKKLIQFLKNNPLSRYLREAYVEMHKVSWPNGNLVKRHTIIVIGISLFIALYFTLADYLLNLGLEAII